MSLRTRIAVPPRDIEHLGTLPAMEPLHRAAYDCTEEDVIALTVYNFRKSRLLEETYRRNWRNGIIAGIIVAGTSAAFAYMLKSDPRQRIVAAGLVVISWAIVWPFYAWRHLSRRAFMRKMDELAKRAVRERKLPVVLGPAEVLLYPDQLMVIENNGSFAKPWAAVIGAVQVPDAAYITFTDEAVLRIPRRAFADEHDLDRFLSIVEEHIGGRSDGPIGG